MSSDAIWATLAVIVPTFVGLAFGLVAMTPASFRAARVCFWIAAIALCVGAATWCWSSASAYRFSIATVVLSFDGLGLIACLRWVSGRETIHDRDVATLAATPHMGNLRERAFAFADELVEPLYRNGWGEHPGREKDMPTEGLALSDWRIVRSRYFLDIQFTKACAIRDEFASLRYRNMRLDRLLASIDNVWSNLEEPRLVPPSSIEGVAEALRALARGEPD